MLSHYFSFLGFMYILWNDREGKSDVIISPDYNPEFRRLDTLKLSCIQIVFIVHTDSHFSLLYLFIYKY